MSGHSGAPRDRTAHCSCGSLRVATIGEPLAVITCFCEECQRRTGSAFSPNLARRTKGETDIPTSWRNRPARLQTHPTVGRLDTLFKPCSSSASDNPQSFQTWKLSPQPQRPFSFGLVNVKPAVSAFVS